MSKKKLVFAVVLATLVVVAIFIFTYVGRSSKSVPLAISSDSVVLKKGCVCDDSSCLYVSFHYPVVTCDNSNVVTMLLFADYLQAIGDSSKATSSGTIKDYLNQVAFQYDSIFAEYQSAFPAGAVNTWYSKTRYSILMNDGELLSLQYYTENYMGGAHGNHTYHYFNMAPKLAAVISLPDVIADMDAFAEKAEDSFRTHFKIPQGKSLDNYWFPNSRFQLPAEFGFTKEGVVLHYNVYEIAPYSDGDIRIVVPYSEFKDVLKPEYSYLAKP